MEHKVIIEIGTNTMKALYARRESSGWNVISDSIFPTRIGEGTDQSGFISPSAMTRNLRIIGDIINSYSKETGLSVQVIATQSLRKVNNAEDFIQAVRERFGLEVRVLTGEEEAQLAYWAGAGRISDADETATVLDIGGGSTEISVGKNGQIVFQTSLPFGAVSLTERFFKHDPVLETEMDELVALLTESLTNLSLKTEVTRLIGIGGTVTTLALLINPSLSEIDGMALSRDFILQQIIKLSKMTNREKQNLPGMPDGRGDIILAGTLILHHIMNKYGFREVTVSIKGVRHGYLFSHN